MRMRSIAAALLAIALSTAMAHAAESPTTLRCGWFQNPTPGNAWLIDRQGEWVVGTQGGHQAQGDWPEFDDREWVATNGHYGYGCACLRVIADPQTREVRKIVTAKAQPLRACAKDKAIAKSRPKE